MQIVEIVKAPKRRESVAFRAAKYGFATALLGVCLAYVYFLIELTPRLIVENPYLYTSPERLLRRTRNVCLLLTFLYVAISLYSARKFPVLFLRRFGSDVNFVVSSLMKAGLGRQFRFITLDDSRFPSLGTSLMAKLVSLLAPPLTALLFLVGAFGLMTRLGKATDIGVNLRIETVWVIAYWTGVFFAVILLVLGNLYRVRRDSRVRVRSERELWRLIHRLRKLETPWTRPRFMAPQATVTTVSDEFWQRTVAEVARRVPIVLIDVSEPTANVQWEIEHVRTTGHAYVLIAEREHLLRWLNTANPPTTDAAAGISALVGDDPVIVYSASERKGGPQFGKNLRNALLLAAHQRCGRAHSARMPTRRWLWQFVISFAYRALYFAAVIAAGTALAYIIMVLAPLLVIFAQS